MQNLQRRFNCYYIGQIYGGDFAKLCGLLRIYELYKSHICSTLFSRSHKFLAPHINELETFFAILYFWTFAQCEKEMTTARLRQKCKKLSIHRGVTNKDCIRANKFKAFYFLQPIQLVRKTFYETFKKCTKHLHKSFQSKQNIAQMKTEKCLFMRYLLTREGGP